MNLKIIDFNSALISALRNEFGQTIHSEGYPEVEVIEGNIFSYVADAIVSPANSFGYMDGGLDYHIRECLGHWIEGEVKREIKEKHGNELPVGSALSISAHNSDIHPKEFLHMRPFKYLIVAPTMRLPSDVSGTINAYLAMKAAVNIANNHPDINSVVMSGLCTLSGRMPPHIAARQMRCGYEYVVSNKFRYDNWRDEKQFEEYLKFNTP